MTQEVIELHRDYLHSEIDRILSDENINSSRLNNVISLVELKTLILSLRNLEEKCRFKGIEIKFNQEYTMWRERE